MTRPTAHQYILSSKKHWHQNPCDDLKQCILYYCEVIVKSQGCWKIIVERVWKWRGSHTKLEKELS
jgi:hypothetical protein